MSSTIGIMFQVAGETLFPATWNDRQPFINLHLISSSTPPVAGDAYPYPWTEVSNPSYQAQSIPADSVTVTSDSLGSYGLVGETQWPFAAYSGPAVTVNGWWMDDRRTPTPTPLWGGPLNPPYPIPHAGGLLTIDSITLTLRDCATVPPPPLPPYVVWADMFVDHTPTHLVSHRPIVGTAYSAVQGNFGIDGPALICTTLTNSDACRWDDHAIPFRVDYDLVLRWTPAANYAMIAFVYRFQDLVNNFALYIDLGAGVLVANKTIAGVTTNLATAAIAVENLDCCHLTLFDDGTGTINVSFNFSNKLNVFDPDLLGETRKGFLYFSAGAGGTVFVLNLLVVSPQNAI